METSIPCLAPICVHAFLGVVLRDLVGEGMKCGSYRAILKTTNNESYIFKQVDHYITLNWCLNSVIVKQPPSNPC